MRQFVLNVDDLRKLVICVTESL